MGKKVRQSGILYVVPALAMVALVMLYPLVYTLIISFFKNRYGVYHMR